MFSFSIPERRELFDNYGGYSLSSKATPKTLCSFDRLLENAAIFSGNILLQAAFARANGSLRISDLYPSDTSNDSEHNINNK